MPRICTNDIGMFKNRFHEIHIEIKMLMNRQTTDRKRSF